MLEYLRDMSGKPVAKVLIGILMFSFVGWGVAEWVLGNVSRDTTLIKVGGTEITAEQFNAERSRELSKLPRDQQKRVYTEPEFANTFFSEILTDLTNNTLIENRANDLGFVVTDKRVASEIRAFPEFQNNGKFSPIKFDMMMNGFGLNESQFADYLRGQIKRSMVLGSMSAPLDVPEFALKAAYNSRYGQKQIEYATVNFGDFKVPNPTEEQLREFYAKNPKINLETRSVSYVLVPTDMSRPDSYDVGFDRVQKLEDAIIGGESMSAAAAKNNAKFVSLPAFSKNKRPVDPILSDTIISKIFSMDQGMESEIIEIKQGFLIVRVENIKPEHTAEFESAKSGLVDAWKKEEQKKQAYLRANDLLISLNKDGTLSGKKAATVSRTSGAPTDVLVAAFTNASGSNSIVPSANAFYVMRIVKEIAPKVDTAKMASLRKELQNMTTRGVMDDYNSFLMREYPVKINKKAFDKMFTK